MPHITTRRPKPPKDFDENPAWTAADFERAVPMAAAFPQFVEGLKRGPGRPRSEKPKVAVSLRLDPEAVAAFQATGKGWQVRVNDVLVKASKKLSHPTGLIRGKVTKVGAKKSPTAPRDASHKARA